MDGLFDGAIDREGIALVDGLLLTEGRVDADGSSVGATDKEGLALIDGGLLGYSDVVGLKDKDGLDDGPGV